jgi:hypothetical protein
MTNPRIKRYMLRASMFLLGTVLFWGATFPFSLSATAAEECACSSGQDTQSCNASKIACFQDKVNQKQQEANTLSGVISVLNGKIKIQELQIKQTQLEIKKLETDIQDLGQRISGLNVSLDRLTEVLIERVGTNYKRRHANPFSLLLISDTLASFFTEYKYLQIAQKHTSQMMTDAENQRTVFDQEKLLKEKKQLEIDQKKQQLQKEQSVLTQQRTDEQNLLKQTKNDEARYQELLAQAKAEIDSFRSFTTGLGGSVLPPQNSPDGWYFSQRDERWARACIGNSCGTRNEGTILEVGCLVASTAMVKKKMGEDVTPLTIARNSSYFFSTTSYMLRPWPTPGGYTYVRSGLNQSKLDEELKAGRPVIVHLRITTRDGHFVVIKSGENGKYIMHDPYEGYDKNFSDFYRLNQIDQMSWLQKS